jgi:hypothetical protein
MLDDLDLSSIADDRMRELVVRLLNIIETLTADLRAAQAENQRLPDEIARLKGEQGKPPTKSNTPSPPSPDHSSERERHQPAERVNRGKRDQIVIDRTQDIAVDPAILPPDAQFKGSEEVVVQDVLIRTDTILFRKEKWYAPSTGQTYLAPLPPGYQGAFGPGVQALILLLYFARQMTEPKIADFFAHVGVSISDGQISNLLIKDQERFHAELDERIALTRAKKANLLLVLEHPEIPLHNNPAELGARQRVRKRAISFGPRTADGAKAWDTFMSLAATTKQLGLSFYRYIHDRISGANQIPPLDQMIDARAKECNLGASWSSS